MKSQNHTTLKFKDRRDQDDPYAVWMNWGEGGMVTRALGMTMMLKPPLDGRPDIHGGKMNNIEIFIEPGKNCPLNSIGPGTVVATDIQSSIATAKQWLRICETSHEQCKKTNSARLPTRVLDVGVQHRTDLTSDPVLYETRGQEARFIALSHCWGKTPIITTTKETKGARMTGIEWNSLSRTFQDAVMITRMLGVQYLWIDSLCIIQDDPTDWQKEAAQMASIYGEAYLTISADNSVDGNGGCYCVPYPTFEVGKARSPVDDTAFKIYAREKPDHNRFRYWAKPSNPGMEKDAFETYPLLTRAWCFQERLLPTRILHFTSQELFFECKTEDRCECINFHPRPFAAVRKPLKHIFSELLSRGDETELLRQWTDILESYTYMGRTQDSDILIALAGIAKTMQEAGLRDYHAGIWKANLAYALNWKPRRNEGFTHRRPTSYTAPSWSWASVIGPIEWDHLNSWHINTTKHFYPVILSYKPTLLSEEDEFGALSAASLKIHAPLARVTIYSTHDDGISNPRLKIHGLPDFEHGNLQFDVSESCALAISSPDIFLMQTEALINEKDERQSRTNTMILKRREDGAYERIGLAKDLRVGVFEKQFGPWTEIVLV
ncbi:hypothetical protein FKW77_002398 [Venturia effusa]|uniref:Heterokaryon incompatibility domain-containing protein n=1 Tax=Venturia effusa TaxID=50376 RepID=A0A517LAI3_9PEZI|nr:hypothetical protein FKW77_002398 [Venturia effusa]